MAKINNLFITLFFIITLAYSQNQHINFEKISIEQGLSQSDVTQIVQDQQGFLWFGTTSGLNHYDGYKFNVYYTIAGDTNSLSNNHISCLLVDRKNVLWIGTPDGLSAYDITNDTFSHFRNIPNNPSSISDNKITDIYEDRKGYIWICTNNGLNNYDRNKNLFIRYHYSDQISDNFYNIIRCVSEDNENNILFGTYNGLYVISATDHIKANPNHLHLESSNFRRMPTPKTSWGEDLIFELYKDRSGIIWIGTPGLGLIRYDRNSDIFSRVKSQLKNGEFKSTYGTNSIYQDRSGTLWIGTNMGLFVYDKEGEKIIYKAFEGKNINHIFEDQSGVLWISVSAEGLRKYVSENQKFPPYLEYGKLAVFYDKNDDLWLGDLDGIYKYNRNTLQYIKFPLKPYRVNFVSAIHQDSKDRLWIGSYDVYKFNRNQSQFEIIDIDYDKSLNLPATDFSGEIFKRCHVIVEDKKGNLWVGARTGLYKYNYEMKTLMRYSYDATNSNSISHNTVKSIYQDRQGVYWVGTQRGLNKFDPVSETFTRYLRDPSNPNSISDNDISDIYESRFDINGPLWIATNGGLNRFDRADQIFTHYTINNGLPHNGIRGILEDDHGNLWLSTHKGLSKFDPKSERFKNFYKSDGLQDNAFNHSAFRNKTGEMFFGGPNGLSVFHPDSIKDDPHVPPIVITGFKKFNEEVKLDTAISQIKKITIAHDEKVISFEFAALNYANPMKNQFAYMLEGFDKDWMYPGYKHDVTYTNLAPGAYVFRVKGSNQDGVWNEEGTSLHIFITPPWWRTTWAYIIYFLLFGIIVYGTWHSQTKRQRLKQQARMEHFEAEKLREIDHIKSRFFANISHEFRTPLTLILGPAKQMLTGQFTGDIRKQCGMIIRNGERLLKLINQLLDLSKLESGRMKLQVKRTEIIQFLKPMVLSFSALAEVKKIRLTFISEDKSIMSYIDRDKIEKVITNLLSNALKFTPKGGEIIVDCGLRMADLHPPKSPLDRGEGSISPLEKGDKGGCIEIKISNTGPEIPQDKLDKIFDRFYQENDSVNHLREGTGIGLALTKELVELHRGIITVSTDMARHVPTKKHPPQSPFFKGELSRTTFTILLPISKEHFTEDEVSESGDRRPETGMQILPISNVDEDIITEIKEKTKSTVRSPDSGLLSTASNLQTPVSGLRSPLLLIVEDNAELTTYMKSFLEKEYRIITTENGKLGWKRAIEKFPDLIIADVIMAKMDGFELCRRLKSDERTSHIPVILLTAKADLASKIEGLEFGADDYISKPFEADELKARIKNLIELRHKLKERFQRELKIYPKEVTANSMDEKLLDKICTIVEQHIDDVNFSAGKLAIKTNMSHRNLNRKLKALMDHSAGEFISIMRLKRAAQLLQTNSDSISQIAYQVGFSNMSYFTRIFHRQFGSTPSQYRNQFQKQKTS